MQIGLAGMGSWQRQANKAWQGKCGPANAAQAGRHRKLAGLWSRSVRFWRECGGAGRSENGLGPNLRSPPTYRLCLSLSTPTPLICNNETTKFSPFFLFLSFFYNFVSLTPFIVFVRLTYPVNLAYSQPLKSFLRGLRKRLVSCLEAQQSLRIASTEFSNLPTVSPAAYRE